MASAAQPAAAARVTIRPFVPFDNNLFGWQGAPQCGDYGHMYQWMTQLSQELDLAGKGKIEPLLAALKNLDTGYAPIPGDIDECETQMAKFKSYIDNLSSPAKKKLEIAMLAALQ